MSRAGEGVELTFCPEDLFFLILSASFLPYILCSIIYTENQLCLPNWFGLTFSPVST